MIVADANVVVAFAMVSEKHAIAREVFRLDNDWHAPRLWESEVRNVLALHVRTKRVQIGNALTAMAIARSLIPRLKTHEVDDKEVLLLANETSNTAYDCEYVAVSKRLNAPLVTWDKSLLRTFPDLATSPEIYLEKRF